LKLEVTEPARPALNSKLQTPSLFLLPLLMASLFFSCKSAKEASKIPGKKFDADSVLVELERNTIQFEWLYAKARVNYEDQSQSKSFTASIRMRSDSVIWISVTTMMGVEAARLLIHNDTVFLLDKLSKKYQTEALSYLENYFPFPLDIFLLQKILVGNPLMMEPGNAAVRKEKRGFSISSENNLYRYTASLNEDDLSISTEYLVDRQNDRKISLVFDDYKIEGGRLFSYARNISFSGDEKINLSLRFSKVKWDEPQAFPFHVRDKYDE
jgi:hypothetical protein